MREATARWRRVGALASGQEVCALAGRSLWGVAEWDGGAASYRIECAQDWSTQRALVLTGDKLLDITRGVQGWAVNGQPVAGVESAIDIDLGFSPATNTLPVKRLRLDVGEAGELVAAWLDPDDWALKPLPQRYTRLGAERWRYETLGSDFVAELRLGPDGLVRDYAGLWEADDGDG